MGRSPCCEKVGLKKGPWTHEEDLKLLTYIDQHGDGNWRALPAKAGLQRCGKSCRLRWINYLRPDIKRGKFSLQEEQIIVQLHALLGNKWSVIAAHLPKRTDNEIKNFWNTHVKKKLTKMGIDPVTHKPINVTPASDYPSSGLGQWKTVCQETEAMYLPYDSTLGQASVTWPAWPKAWNALPITSGDDLMWPNYNNGAIFTDHMHKSIKREKEEGSIFQNPSENIIVDHDHDHGHENDMLLFGSNFQLGNNFEQDMIERNRIGNYSSCSKSDNGMIMRGNCSFGYGSDEQGNVGRGHGANFENNNVSTNYWDNIMNTVDDFAVPFHDPPAASASPFIQ